MGPQFEFFNFFLFCAGIALVIFSITSVINVCRRR